MAGPHRKVLDPPPAWTALRMVTMAKQGVVRTASSTLGQWSAGSFVLASGKPEHKGSQC